MEQELNISEIFQSLKNRWKYIVISLLVCTLIGAIFSFFIVKPKYESSTKVFIGKDEGQDVSYDQNDLSMYQKLLKTYGEVLKTKDLAKSVIANKQLDIKPGALISGLTVNPIADTQIIQIKYTSNSSYDAAVVLEGVKDEFIKVAMELVPNANIRVIENVRENVNPISPNKKMNIAISILVGLMIGVGIVFLLEFMDNTFKSKEALENELELPVVGIIPNMNEGAKHGRTSNKY